MGGVGRLSYRNRRRSELRCVLGSVLRGPEPLSVPGTCRNRSRGAGAGERQRAEAQGEAEPSGSTLPDWGVPGIQGSEGAASTEHYNHPV